MMHLKQQRACLREAGRTRQRFHQQHELAAHRCCQVGYQFEQLCNDKAAQDQA